MLTLDRFDPEFVLELLSVIQLLELPTSLAANKQSYGKFKTVKEKVMNP